MGVAEVFGEHPASIARAYLGDAREMARRQRAADRVRLYRDDYGDLLRRKIGQWFDNSTVKSRVSKFADLGSSQAIFKRIVNTVARPVYAVSPVRTIDPESEQQVFASLAAEVRLNEKMDAACRLATACNTVFLYTRYVERLGKIVVDILTPDMVTVIPDPDDVTRELGLIYQREVRRRDGTIEKVHVFWDDTHTFQIAGNGAILPFAGDSESIRRHGLPRMPFLAIHRQERVGGYWDNTTGDDAVAAQLACSLLNVLSIRLLKAQGFNQILVEGDIPAFPKGQILDEEGAVQVPEGTSVNTLALKTDANHYQSLADSIKTDAAANHGISRARLNQDRAEASSDEGLQEERADAVKIMFAAELEQFEILKMVSLEHKKYRLSPDATMSLDFGEWQHRVDEKTMLELWDQKRSMGIACVLDHIKSVNPEIADDAQAWAELERNLKAETKWVEKKRALEIPKDANAREAGQDPADNGALGPLVRDGMMSKDAAAEIAKGGKPDLRALALKVLKGGKS